MDLPEFRAWPKLSRLNREMVITEKLDGTNACVVVTDSGVFAQSRTRIITPEADNFGFAAWVRDNAAELSELGPGYHYGEWWGKGIQRGYGATERYFSLFNTSRWGAGAPKCCRVVPVIDTGNFCTARVNEALNLLRTQGSFAIPFMNPEGVVVFHTASNTMFKVTLENDGQPKSANQGVAYV